jgi:hypothetical protein
MLKIGLSIGMKKEYVFLLFLVIPNELLIAETIEYTSPNSINKIYCEVIGPNNYLIYDHIIYIDNFGNKNSIGAFKGRSWGTEFI